MSANSPFRHRDLAGSASAAHDGGPGRINGNGPAPHDIAGNGSTSEPGGWKHPSRLDELERQQARLTLICEAMWELLSEEVGLGFDQLAAMVDQVVVRDEAAATDLEPRSCVCPDCGEQKLLGAKVCLFCAARTPGSQGTF